jgi:ribosome-binding factor A
MSRRQRKLNELRNLAAEQSSEDGGDAKEFHAKPRDAPKQASRKGQQLCGQVKEALHTALAGCADEILQALNVVRVEPAPHTGRLLVRVVTEDPAAARQSLQRAAGFLRSHVASAISRRYTPELVFEVIA